MAAPLNRLRPAAAQTDRRPQQRPGVSRRPAPRTRPDARRRRPVPDHRPGPALLPPRRRALRRRIRRIDTAPAAPLRDHPPRRSRRRARAADGPKAATPLCAHCNATPVPAPTPSPNSPPSTTPNAADDDPRIIEHSTTWTKESGTNPQGGCATWRLRHAGVLRVITKHPSAGSISGRPGRLSSADTSTTESCPSPPTRCGLCGRWFASAGRGLAGGRPEVVRQPGSRAPGGRS
jgi:hypothetical protein